MENISENNREKNNKKQKRTWPCNDIENYKHNQ